MKKRTNINFLCCAVVLLSSIAMHSNLLGVEIPDKFTIGLDEETVKTANKFLKELPKLQGEFAALRRDLQEGSIIFNKNFEDFPGKLAGVAGFTLGTAFTLWCLKNLIQKKSDEKNEKKKFGWVPSALGAGLGVVLTGASIGVTFDLFSFDLFSFLDR